MGTTGQFSGMEAIRQNPLLLTPEAGFVPAEMPGLRDRKSTRLNSSHYSRSRMPSSA